MFRLIFSKILITLCFLLIFTPLEKATDFNRHSLQLEVDGGLMFQSAKIVNVPCSLMGITSSTKAAVLYIDPGTGSLLFQILSAIILAILFYLSLIRKTLGRLFGKVKKIFLNQKVDT